MDLDIDRDAIVRTFQAEAEEGLSAMEEALVALESRPQDEELLGTVFRIVHTLKGNSSSLGFDGLVGFAHVLEDLLEGLRKRRLEATPELVTLLLEAVDALRALVPAAAGGDDERAPAHEALLVRLGQRLPSVAQAASSRDAGVREADAGPGEPSPARAADRTLRVDVEKLDRLLNLAGEIAISRGRLRQILEAGAIGQGDAPLEVHGEADRLHAELQELVMKARMVAVGPTFRQHFRTVRDLAASQGKQARLRLEGEDVEVDTKVIEHMRDPLTHMVRNAVDHGIEPPERRRSQGKDPCGCITLRACHDGGSIVIQVSDDGAGLVRRRILERAGTRGGGADGERFAEADIHRLIFEPGFSTAEAVTAVSGRGVGLDVVRRNIDALRGEVSVESVEGQGATFTLRLPLTLAIIQGFGVAAGGETYVVPLDAVVECLELPREGTPGPNGSGVLSLRGEALPYLRLREHFGLEGMPSRREHVVVVQGGGRRAGFAVDTLLGESQVVIKALGRLFQGISGVSGSAILANGRVALILDVPGLLREVFARQGAALGREAQEQAGRMTCA